MKRLMAKIDEYQKDGKTKGNYIEVGVLNENTNGEYILLNAEFCIAGILLKQSQLAYKTNKPQPMNVILSVFSTEDQPKPTEPIKEDDIPY